MAVIAANRVTRLTLRYTIEDVESSNTFYYTVGPTGGAVPAPAALAGAFIGGPLDLWQAIVSDEVAFHAVDCYSQVERARQPWRATLGGRPGSRSGNPVPSNVAIFSMLRQGEVRQSIRRRLYIGGISEDDCEAGIISTDGGYLDDVKALLLALASPIAFGAGGTADDFFPVLHHSADAPGSPVVAAGYYLITGYFLTRRLAQFRRRQRPEARTYGFGLAPPVAEDAAPIEWGDPSTIWI